MFWGVGNLLPGGDFRARCALVSYFELDKAMYEAGYELNNRPDWAVIPLKGILQIMERRGEATQDEERQLAWGYDDDA